MTFQLQRIEKKRAYKEIVEAIWKAIEDNGLHPGDRLPSEAELSRQLEVARPTLREALSVLHYLGVVDSVQGGGYYVKSLLPPALAGDLAMFQHSVSPYDLVTARLALEPEISRLAARTRDDQDLAKLEAVLAKVPQDPPPGRYPMEVDHAFHLGLAEASKNALLISMVNSLFPMQRQPIYKALLAAGYGTERYLENVGRDHRLVLEAVRRGDPEGACQAMRRHLLNVKRHLFGENGEGPLQES